MTSSGRPALSLPGPMNIVSLHKCFYYKERYLMSLVQEIDLALSMFFYCIIFLTQDICADPAQYLLFTMLVTGCKKYFHAFPKIPCSSEFSGDVSSGTVFNCDLSVSLTYVSLSVSFCFEYLLCQRQPLYMQEV